MLERLVGGERPAEGVAVEHPLPGELQHAVDGTDEFGALQHDGELELALDGGRGTAGRSHERGGRDAYAGEVDACEAAHHVEALQRKDGHAVRVALDDELAQALGGMGEYQERVRVAAVLDAVVRAVKDVTVPVGPCLDRARFGVPAPSRRTAGPGGDHRAVEQPAEESGVPVRAGRLGEGGGDDVDHGERSGRAPASELLGDDRRVDDPLAGDAAAARLLRHDERRPPEFRPTPPGVPVERAALVVQRADHAERGGLLQVVRCRRLQQALVGGQFESHDGTLSSRRCTAKPTAMAPELP